MTLEEATTKVYLALASDANILSVAAYPYMQKITEQQLVWPDRRGPGEDSVLVQSWSSEAPRRVLVWGLLLSQVMEMEEPHIAQLYRKVRRRADDRWRCEAWDAASERL